jgi:hypothetical protein
MKKYLLLALLTLPFFSNAQRWKKNRKEIVYSVGAANFLGDLGGADQIGTNFVKDLEMNMTRPSLGGGYRYRIHPYFFVKGSAYWGRIKSSDFLTAEDARRSRELSFRSNIFEISGQLEYTLIQQKDGHHYKIKHVKGWKSFMIQPYFFVGAGLTYFNPKALYNGKWTALQPLGTEGQGIDPGTKKYTRITACFPVGLGFRYAMSKKYTIGLEYGYRYTLTDYMDDVSTNYYDPVAIGQAYGPAAQYFSDPSGNPNGYATAGQQRGDPKDRDGYMFALVTLNYKLGKTYKTRAKF